MRSISIYLFCDDLILNMSCESNGQNRSNDYVAFLSLFRYERFAFNLRHSGETLLNCPYFIYVVSFVFHYMQLFFFYLMNFKLSKDIIFGASIYELYVQALKNSNPWGWMVYITILHSGLKSERSAIYGRWDRKCCLWKPKINIFWKNFEQNGIEEACAWF